MTWLKLRMRSEARTATVGTLWRASLVLSLASLVSCGGEAVDAGGESNWLRACDEDAECGDIGSCRCGVCTLSCDANSDCGGLDNARCATVDSAAALGQCVIVEQALCLPKCEDDRDCAGEQECRDGACILADSSAKKDSDSSQSVMNPTGDCVAQDNGGGLDHSPDTTDVYLPDCELPLAREYYRVFQQVGGTAYMIPRPDGHPDLFNACVDDEHPMAQIVQDYALCETASSAAAVAQVNAIDPADALALAHYLHEQMVFLVTDYGVSPGAKSDDILEACTTDEEFRAGPLKTRCDFELEHLDGPRPAIGFSYTREQSEALAIKMNELYGIDALNLCARLANSASGAVSRAFTQSPATCETDDDCLSLANASACHDSCTWTASISTQASIQATIEQVDANQCSTWELFDCGPKLIPECASSEPPTCVDGTCGGTSE